MPPPAPLPNGGNRKSQLPSGPYDPRYVLAQSLDPAKQEIRFRVTTAAGGVVDAGQWQTTTDPSILVGDGVEAREVPAALAGLGCG